jgi:hypothetical protein
MKGKIVASMVLAIAGALGLGWVWGAWGKAEVEQAQRAASERADLASARAELLDGRLSLLKLNFGDAHQHFDAARKTIEDVQRRVRETEDAERAGRLEIVLAHVRDAERLAVALKPEAQDAAAEAVAAMTAAAPR